MKAVDRWLQTWRINAARPHIPVGSAVLDVGTADGVLFRRLGSRIGSGVGIDPDVTASTAGNVRLVAGMFPYDLDVDDTFDVITALAVFEHLSDDEGEKFAVACYERLRPGGACILTIPSAGVDAVLKVLLALRIIDGMHEGDHHGFDTPQTPAIFGHVGFALRRRRRFQLGFNNLFVFTKPDA